MKRLIWVVLFLVLPINASDKPPKPCTDSVFTASVLAYYEGKDEANNIAVFIETRTGLRIHLPASAVSNCFKIGGNQLVHISVTQENAPHVFR